MSAGWPQHPTRSVVVSRNGAVAASHPLAVSAAVGILKAGGNFIDAALACSAVLAVVEPMNSHLGGDAFVIVYDAKSKQTKAYNGSGAAPRRATPATFPDGIPLRGPRAASVPGLVSAWQALHDDFGTIPLARLLEPATGYARNGFPAAPRYARSAADFHQQLDWARPMLRTLTGRDDAIRAGDVVRQPDLAWSLEEIAKGGRDAFYRGAIAERLVRWSEKNGGLFSKEDLASHATHVSVPILTTYRGYEVHGQPPVSQGHILLQMLNLAEGFPLGDWGWGDPKTVHVLVEAKRLAFADRQVYLADPKFRHVPIKGLLSKEYAAKRRAEISLHRASERVEPGHVDHDTTYFCVADKAGNAVSFIQSIYHGFGSGAVVDGTGILLNNRLTGFSLDPTSPNILEPGKRTAHTLNAWLMTKDGDLAWVGGTPGGDIQVQSNAQVISSVVDFGLGPQEAVEAARWQHGGAVGGGGLLELESRFPVATQEALTAFGHRVSAIGPWAHGSCYQLIQRDLATGVYFAGSDPRCDGHAAGI